jgi:hypothetical protein
MSAFYVFAVALGLVIAGVYWVSWAVAGAVLCLFATIALVHVCRPSEPIKPRPDAS